MRPPKEALGSHSLYAILELRRLEIRYLDGNISSSQVAKKEQNTW